jgi:hypothetical protein
VGVTEVAVSPGVVTVLIAINEKNQYFQIFLMQMEQQSNNRHNN